MLQFSGLVMATVWLRRRLFPSSATGRFSSEGQSGLGLHAHEGKHTGGILCSIQGPDTLCRNEVEERVLFRHSKRHMPAWELPDGGGISAQNGLPVMRSAFIDAPLHDPQFGLRSFDPLMEGPVLPMQVACNGHIAVPGSRLF